MRTHAYGKGETAVDIPAEQQTLIERRLKKIQPLKPFTVSQQSRQPRRQHRSADADADADDVDADASPLPQFCRFKDLVEAGIVSNRMQLARMIAHEGFPVGFKLSANIHVFDVSEVRRFLQAKQQDHQAK